MRRWGLPVLLLIAAAIALTALILHNQRVANEMASETFVPRATRMTPEIELLQRYVRIDTSNPPGKELAGARFLQSELRRNGIASEIIESAPGRGNLYARIRGKKPGDGLLLLNHIDVVPATLRGWSRPPFAGAVLANQVFGRGTLDMKGIAICELEAFIDVARSGRVPEHDLVFLATADEELGGALGVQWLLAHRPEIFQGIRYCLNEGGITETKQERISYFGIEIGTKMAVKLIIHAASREGLQAIRLRLEPFINPPDPERISPEVREFLHDVAPLRVEQQPLLTDIDRTVAAGKFWLLSSGYKELMQNVMWLGGVQVQGQEASMRVNMFNLPEEEPLPRIEWLRGIVEPMGGRVELLETNGPAPLTSRHTPMFDLIAREVKREYPGVPVGTEILVAWSNDSRFLRARGIDAYGVWPFPVDFYQTQGIHSVNERVRADWFQQGVNLTRRLVGSYSDSPH
ncbi:MAG: M20/M25/M40 family metallo-hydrolase [Thermoanaerobaculia bacterium]